MKTNQKGLRDVMIAAALASVLAIPTVGYAQSRNRSAGRTSGGGGYARSAGTRSGGATRSSYTGGRRTTSGRTGYTGGSTRSTGRTGYTGAYSRPSSGTTYGRTGYSGGTYRNARYGGGGSYNGYSGRAQGFAPQIGFRYSSDQWRQYHPDWNGNYYFHDGLYFYDPLFQFPAVVANTWDTIALAAGGVEIADALAGDPYIYFDGPYGDLFPVDSVAIDLGSGNPRLRTRAAFFERPYFYHNGVRFDRETVERGGQRFYRFARR